MLLTSAPALRSALQTGTFVDQLLVQETAIVRGLLVFSVTLITVYILARFIALRYLSRWLSEHEVDPSIISMIRLAGQIVCVVLALGVATSVAGFGSITTALSAVSGAVAIAVGLAANDLIGNLLAGMYIINERLFKVGDWIEWGDQRGRVERIDLRVTRVRTFDNEQVAVPNSTLANTAITNPVAFGRLRISVRFDVGIGQVERATGIILKEADSFPEIMAEPAPSVRIAGLGDRSVGLDARVWMREPSRADFNRLRTEYVQNVLERFSTENIEPDPQTVRLSGGIDIDDGEAATPGG